MGGPEPAEGVPAARSPAPSLGVVVPTLDEARCLPRLLARLLDPAAPAADRAERVVVADGGSADGTRELAAAGGCLLVHASGGRGAQLAAGARALETDLLLFLHADCVPAPGALERLRAAFRDGALQVAAMSQRVEARGLFYRCVESAADLRARLGVVYGDSGLCLRRPLYEAVGGFADLPLFEDVELSRRLRRRARARLVCDARLLVSSRRWRAEGPLRCSARNWILSAAFLAGVSPRRLARYYRPQRAAHPPRGASGS